MKPILKLNNVSFSYISSEEKITIIDSLSFEIKSGEILSIIGPEKCGKSTILSIIFGLIEPTSGFISCDNSHIGYMVQNGDLLQWHNAYRNFSKHYCNSPEVYNHSIPNLKSSNCYTRNSSCKCLEKKAALIKTLSSEPDLLLFDEPFSSFDIASRAIIQNEIINLIHLEHKSAIFVSSNINEALAISDHVIFLSKMPCRIIKEFNTTLCYN